MSGAPWCTGNKQDEPEAVVIVARAEKATCYFRCKLGFYNQQVGEAVKYTCKASDNRLHETGVAETPRQCTGMACHNRHLHSGRLLGSYTTTRMPFDAIQTYRDTVLFGAGSCQIIMFITIWCSSAQRCSVKVKDLDPLIIPDGVQDACTPDSDQTIQLLQRRSCRLQCKIGFSQSSAPYQKCNPNPSRTSPAGQSRTDKDYCTGANDNHNSKQFPFSVNIDECATLTPHPFRTNVHIPRH